MSTAIPSPAVMLPLSPAARALRWYREALRLWRRTPFLLVALCLTRLLVEGLLQLIPWGGVVISKLVVPMLAAGVWLGLEQLQHGGRLRFACLWAAWRQPRWPVLWAVSGSVGVLVFGFQLACVTVGFSGAAIDVVLFGHMAAHPALQTRTFELALMLPGLIAGTLLGFAVPLRLFRGAGYVQALGGSLQLVASAPTAIILAMLPQLGLFALVFVSAWTMPLLLVLLPLGTLVGYTAWRDLAAAASASGDAHG